MATDIYIEGQKLDLFKDETINVRSVAQDVKDISKIYADYSQSFTVPASDNNNNIFKRYYNPDIDNGYDARTRKASTIDLDTLDFKVGKMRLDSVKIKENQPQHYRITFFGNVIQIKDLIGDDLLSDLDWLDNFNHEITDENIIKGMNDGLDFTIDGVVYPKAIIYPLISYKRQFIYNSDVTDTTSTENAVNIHYDPVNKNDGVTASDLRPAIKLDNIIKAINIKYGINFIGSLFNSSNFTSIYTNLYSGKEEVFNNIYSFEQDTHDKVGTTSTLWRFDINIDPQAGYLNIPYRYELIINDEVIYSEETFSTGSKEIELEDIRIYDDQLDLVVNVISNSSMIFDIKTEIFEWMFRSGRSFYNSTQITQVRDLEIENNFTLSNQFTEIKVIDFLTSIFKMFNCTIASDGGDLIITDLQTWYSQGNIYDVTKYIDTKQVEISRGSIYNEINFRFEETDQIIAEKFKNSNNRGFGDLQFRLTDVNGNNIQDVDGTTLDIDVIFQNPIHERLTDQNTGKLTTLQYCPNFSNDFDYLEGGMFLFYAAQSGDIPERIGFLGSNGYTGITRRVFMPSHSRVLTSGFALNFNVELSEYNYIAQTNNIFSEYYRDYITDIFSIKRRIFNYESILPSILLNKLKLNDRLVINDRRYIINSISSNLTNRNDSLELINDIYDAPLASDILNNSSVNPEFGNYNGLSNEYSFTYVGVIDSLVELIDSGDGLDWITLNNNTIDGIVDTVIFNLEENNTGSQRRSLIRINDGINNPSFIIIQNYFDPDTLSITWDNNIETWDNNIITFDTN